jgi:predicted ArsR family transcriptional regulator
MKPTRLKQIEQALRKRPMTRKELAATVFLSERAVEYNMKKMHERGQVYVAGWFRTSGRIARVYAWSIGTDVPRPPANFKDAMCELRKLNDHCASLKLGNR